MNVEYPLRLFKDDDRPLYVQAADAVRARIADGTARPGDRLPSVRRLSDELGVNPATIVAAYRILAREGLVESRQGSGAFVAADGAARGSAGAYRDREAGTGSEGLLDLSANAPPRTLFPLEDVKRFLAESVDLDGGKAFEYQDAAGYGPLRDILAQRLSDAVAEAGGARTAAPADMHIVSGAQQGIDLAARVLLRRGDTAAVECPGYLGSRDVFLAAGARVEYVPMKGSGMDLGALEDLAASRPLRVVYANPDYQNPTGIRWSGDVRIRLARMAARYGFYVIEDDSLSDFAPAGGYLPPIRALDPSDRVLYVKSFSKSLMPGLRIGCLEAPRCLRERLEAAKRSVDLYSNGLMQRVLYLFLSSGRHAGHAAELRSRCAASIAFLDRAISGLRKASYSWSVPDGGLNVWIATPPGVTGRRFSQAARRHGCLVAPESAFRPDGSADAHLRISCGGLGDEELGRAARMILDTAASLGSE